MQLKPMSSAYYPNRRSNYLIAGNITNAFAIGEIGSEDDFFLVGVEPSEESSYPLLTGNIFDSNGKLLFRLINNVIVFNPGQCSKVHRGLMGYEIYDSTTKLIFKIETSLREIPLLSEECPVTTIKASFYNKSGNLIFLANSGEEDERIEMDAKSVLGFKGEFGLAKGYTEEELEFIWYVFESKGKINEPIRGIIEGEEIFLDGKAIQSAQIKSCRIAISSGHFIMIGQDNVITKCQVDFIGPAGRLITFYDKMTKQ